MAKPTTAVDICNLAMSMIGQSVEITSITDPKTPNEVVLSKWYDQERLCLLREYVWNFAKKKQLCARVSDTPAFDYTDQYALPNKFVRLLSIGGMSVTDYDLDYELEGGYIQMNNSGANSIQLRYISDEENVALFDSLFVNVLTMRIALKIAYKFTAKTSIVNSIGKELAIAEGRAASLDGQERPPRIRRSSKIISRRRSGVSSYYTDGTAG